jgi:hypothetical protein
VRAFEFAKETIIGHLESAAYPEGIAETARRVAASSSPSFAPFLDLPLGAFFFAIMV